MLTEAALGILAVLGALNFWPQRLDDLRSVPAGLGDSEDDRPSKNPRKRKGCLTGGAMLIAAKRPIIDTLALAIASRG